VSCTRFLTATSDQRRDDAAMTAQHLRVAAYGLCLQDERVLLARYV
jgi:hypothetical protein